MIQYMRDPIEGFNRGSLKVAKPVIDWFVKPAENFGQPEV
jgi:hypothetical protein